MGAVVLKAWGVILGVSCRKDIHISDLVERMDLSGPLLYSSFRNLLRLASWCAHC